MSGRGTVALRHSAARLDLPVYCAFICLLFFRRSDYLRPGDLVLSGRPAVASDPARPQQWISRYASGSHRRRLRQLGEEVALTRRQHFPSRGGVDPDQSGCSLSLPPIATRK
ncbi:unnamed protein product [Urochloa humidicola]